MRIKPKVKIGVLIAVILIALILIGTGIYCYLSLRRCSKNADPAVATEKVTSGGIVNILLTGTDISEARTDSISVVSYNPAKGTLNVVSIPRDTLVTIKGENAKINAANVYGGESLLVSTVEELLGIDINYYASIDYTGFDKVVDAIGGVDMTIPYTMDYDDPVQDLHIHFTKGATVHLDGKEAEEFFRWRKNNDGTGMPTGDIGRIDNQHLLLQKIQEKVKSPVNIFKAPSLIHAASSYVTTNMTPSEIIRYGVTFATVNKSNITMSTLQGSTPYIGGISYFVYDKSKNAALVSSLTNGTGKTQINKAAVKVEVLNCSGITGLAAKYAKLLEQKGFSNVTIGNGTGSSTSTISLYGFDPSVNSTFTSEFGIDQVENSQTKSGNFDVVVRLGKNFKFSD